MEANSLQYNGIDLIVKVARYRHTLLFHYSTKLILVDKNSIGKKCLHQLLFVDNPFMFQF